MTTFNLSLGVEHKSFVVYLMLVVALAGISNIAGSGATRIRPSPSRRWW
jgi:hypothetical protein